MSQARVVGCSQDEPGIRPQQSMAFLTMKRAEFSSVRRSEEVDGENQYRASPDRSGAARRLTTLSNIS